jgi:hypothetical protein
MQEFMVNMLQNAETFLNRMPETKGCKLFVRADGNAPLIHNDTTKPGSKKAVIEIGVDNPEIQESRTLVRKEFVYDPSETEPATMLSMMVQAVISDLITFAIGQTIFMYRKAEREQAILVDKTIPVEELEVDHRQPEVPFTPEEG